MPNSNPISVVDIGSNSVRMVIYDGLKRAPMPIFNEKVLCGLATNIDKTGVLCPEATRKAEAAIKRFIKLSQAMGVTDVHLFATAAVRDAKDGHKFVDNLNKKFGINIEIISGETEAKYAGYGVISSMSLPHGVVGDLGGGSLELIKIDKSDTGDAISLPIGPLRIADKLKNRDKVQKHIEKYIEKYPLAEHLSGKSFYAVGGAFRNIAKIHMHRKNYPLKVIHNYKVPADDLLNTLQVVSRMTEDTIIKIPGIPPKRAGFIPYAAILLEHIILTGKPKSVVFAASGVREGFLYAKLDDDRKRRNPLISGATNIMRRIMRTPDYGYELAAWMQPLFDNETDTKREQRLRLAACILSEISCYENTEYRAELAYRRIVDSSLTGIGHRERVFIAKALYCRYSTSPDESILSLMQPLLSTSKIYHAQLMGSAMRLAKSLSGSSSGILPKTKLKVTKKKLTLKLDKSITDLKGEDLDKKMRQLAEVMGLTPEII